MSLKIIDRNLNVIGKSADKLNALIHETAMMILNHANEHGDCTRALTLHNKMPASMRRTMLKLWFETNSPIRFQTKDGLATKVGMLKPEAKGFVPFNPVTADATPFFAMAEANPEKQPIDFDKALKMIESLAKRLAKDVDEGKVADGDADSVKAVVNALTGIKVKRVRAANGNNPRDAVAA